MFRTRFIIFYIFQVLISCNINNTSINKFNVEIKYELNGTLYIQLPKSYSKYLSIYDVNGHYLRSPMTINSNNFVLYDSIGNSFVNILVIYPIRPMEYYHDYSPIKVQGPYKINSDTIIKKFPFNILFDDLLSKSMFQKVVIEDDNYKFVDEKVSYNPIYKTFIYSQVFVDRIICNNKESPNYGNKLTIQIDIDVNSTSLNYLLTNFYGKNIAFIE